MRAILLLVGVMTLAGCAAVPSDGGFVSSEPDPITEQNARERLSFACSAGDAEVCYGLGYFYETGQGGEADFAKAREAYLRACDLGSAKGCARTASLVRSGTNLTEKQSAEQRAREYFQQACDGGDDKGCFSLALYQQAGKGGPTDLPGARYALGRLCGPNHPRSCENLAQMKEQGLGGTVDRLGAMADYRTACEGGIGRGCTKLGTLMVEGKTAGSPEVTQARALFERACNTGSAAGCYNYAVYAERGLGGPRQIAAAQDARSRACEGGFVRACPQ